ncbi:MAG: response regulator [Desulfococcaceae bacterium]|jgi:two-component system cell cycle response regulator/two-component system chemotaxis response regulator CheY|nr:response regulator [Desulfococcaceae bacterium]
MSRKVLIVDDSNPIRMIVKKSLKDYDCEILMAANGMEGLAVASREHPDLIILDINMPLMSGTEMLERLRSEPALQKTAVIMLTSESGKDSVMKILKLGVSSYLVKPFRGDQLIERIKTVFPLEAKKEEEYEQYFSAEGNLQILRLPAKITKPVIAEIETYYRSGKGKKAVESGISRMILDMSRTGEVNMLLIQLMMLIMENSGALSLPIRIVAGPGLAAELRELQETSEIPAYHSMGEAKAAFT